MYDLTLPLTQLSNLVPLAIKGLFLIGGLLYLFFAFFVLKQVHKTESWLMSLKRYQFDRWAVAHLVMAVLGIVFSFLVL